MIIHSVVQGEWIAVDELPQSERNDGGFWYSQIEKRGFPLFLPITAGSQLLLFQSCLAFQDKIAFNLLSFLPYLYFW